MKKYNILNIIKEGIENKEGKMSDNKFITFEVHNDDDGDIEKLIRAIENNSQAGHSFEIIVDPNDKEYEKKFYIDGDGGAKIMNVKIEDIEKEDIEESVYLIDPEDNNMQTKINTIKNNANLFNPDEDTIKIKDEGDKLNMSESKVKHSMAEKTLTKKQIENMILERKYNGEVFTKEELMKKLKKD